jgi:hypothetical protein
MDFDLSTNNFIKAKPSRGLKEAKKKNSWGLKSRLEGALKVLDPNML